MEQEGSAVNHNGLILLEVLRGIGGTIYTNCHLSMKEGSLFCFVVMRSTEPGCFRSCSWCLWQALDEDGCIGFGSMTFGLAVQKFLNME